jgi:crotonobetainyl-CoA:carnitine CoA-transferase CaiB-like acyl-CoA transferase
VLAEARLWDAIADALDLDDLAGLDFAARLAATASINDRIAGAVASLDLDDALTRLEARGAPVSPVLTPEEATVHPQLRARDIHVTTAAGVVVGLPARLLTDGSRTVTGDLPAVDAHPEGFTPR